MAIVTRYLQGIGMLTMMSPASFKKLFTGISGKEKADHLIKTLEDTGAMNKTTLILTSLYAKDKDNFLVPSA